MVQRAQQQNLRGHFLPLLRNLIVVMVLLFVSVGSYAQDSKVMTRIKCEYLWNFGRNIRWQGLDNVDSFHVAFICPDSSLYNAFSRYSGRRKIKRREIKVTLQDALMPVPDAQMIYVAADYNDNIDKLYNEIEGEPVLLVTDSCKSPRSVMINFSPEGSIRVIEANEENIEKQGLKVPGVIMVMTQRQQEDWEEYFNQADSALEAERQIVEQQKAEIILKKAELAKIEHDINELNRALLAKEHTLAEHLHQIGIQRESLMMLEDDIAKQGKLIDDKVAILAQKDAEVKENELRLEESKAAIAEQNEILEKAKAEVADQEAKINEQRGVLSEQQGQIETQQIYIYFFIIVGILGIGFLFVLYRGYRLKKKANAAISQQKAEIEEQRDELEAQREMAVMQRDQITEQNNEIVDSIMYAKRIQKAILPQPLMIEAVLPENFILNKPRDIVSGDFYWIKHVEGKTYVGIADCTGHGVPGAFMSMLGVTSLNDLINQHGAMSADKLLNGLRDKIIYALHQTGKSGESKDGMDLSMLIIDEKKRTIEFAGANNPVYVITPAQGDAPAELEEQKGDKMPIGYHHSGEDIPFTSHTLEYKKGNCLYLFSDGFADQFGGPKGKKFKYKPFKDLLMSNAHLPMDKQEEILNKAVEEWRGDLEQVDDILILGLRI